MPGAIDAMDYAVAAHARRPLPPEIGRTLVEKGALERRAKRKSAAMQTLEAAVELLTLLGARLWAARAHDQLSRIGLRRAAPSHGLTPAQRRVAEMVVSGMSNREISLLACTGLRLGGACAGAAPARTRLPPGARP